MTEQPPVASTDEQILAELKKMNKVTLLVNASKLEAELARYASTEERKKIWVLMDGTKEINELIQGSGLKKTPVYNFLAMLEAAGLVEKSHGKPPKRAIDFVPASWTELLLPQQTPTLEQATSASDQDTKLTPAGGTPNERGIVSV